MTLFDSIPGYKRYDLLVNRAENRTLAISLLESQADLDALTATLAKSETYAHVGTRWIPASCTSRSSAQGTPRRSIGVTALTGG